MQGSSARRLRRECWCRIKDGTYALTVTVMEPGKRIDPEAVPVAPTWASSWYPLSAMAASKNATACCCCSSAGPALEPFTVLGPISRPGSDRP